jgi:hypothetical protein
MFKIQYHVNLLPRMGSGFEQMMAYLADEDVEIFNAAAVRCLIEFKWGQYARQMQAFSAGTFAVYVVTYYLFVDA